MIAVFGDLIDHRLYASGEVLVLPVRESVQRELTHHVSQTYQYFVSVVSA